jgi:hypothetical protein
LSSCTRGNPNGLSGRSASGCQPPRGRPGRSPDRRPAVAAPPGDRELGWFKAADRDADDPLACVDVGVALGQQRYRRTGRHDLKFLVGGGHLGGHSRRLARSPGDGQPEIALCACRSGQRDDRLVNDLGEFDALAVPLTWMIELGADAVAAELAAAGTATNES